MQNQKIEGKGELKKMLDFMIISDNADAIFKIVSRLTVLYEE